MTTNPPIYEGDPLVSAEDQWPKYDCCLGVEYGNKSPQYMIIGKTIASPEMKTERIIAFDTNRPGCYSIVGMPGGGKSYTLGVIAEGVSTPCDGVSRVVAPQCTILVHFADSEYYPPEWNACVGPNTVPAQVKSLKDMLGDHVSPTGIKDFLLLSQRDMLDRRREEFPNVHVEPLSFAPRELRGVHWKALMGASGERTAAMTVLKNCIRELSYGIGEDGRRIIRSVKSHEVESAIIGNTLLSADEIRSARLRLSLCQRFIDEDGPGLSSWIKPGRVIVLDLRDEFMEPEEIFGLLLVILDVMTSGTYKGKMVNKLFVFDECHAYLNNPALVGAMISLIRVMRHKRTTICFASQDPLSIDQRILELSSGWIIHRLVSRRWLEYLQAINTAFCDLTSMDVCNLEAGQGYIWHQRASDTKKAFKPMLFRTRSRFSEHGGFTKTATGT